MKGGYPRELRKEKRYLEGGVGVKKKKKHRLQWFLQREKSLDRRIRSGELDGNRYTQEESSIYIEREKTNPKKNGQKHKNPHTNQPPPHHLKKKTQKTQKKNERGVQ